jgi:tRNA pseudouridine38-40 synthase
MKKSTVRNIREIEIQRLGNEIVFKVTGNGFLHNMMRILVGTLLEVGVGVRSSDSMCALFGASREASGLRMPAAGLCLMEVFY